MSRLFEELDYFPTPMGPLVLRRRWDGTLGKDVYEIKLGDDFLMSSHFTASEVALAELALAELPGDRLSVASAVSVWATPPAPHSRTGAFDPWWCWKRWNR